MFTIVSRGELYRPGWAELEKRFGPNSGTNCGRRLLVVGQLFSVSSSLAILCFLMQTLTVSKVLTIRCLVYIPSSCCIFFRVVAILS